MKRLTTATVLALFALAPAIGSACDYHKSGHAAPDDRLGVAPTPASTKVPAEMVVKAPTAKPAKQSVAKQKTVTSDAKLARAATE